MQRKLRNVEETEEDQALVSSFSDSHTFELIHKECTTKNQRKNVSQKSAHSFILSHQQQRHSQRHLTHSKQNIQHISPLQSLDGEATLTAGLGYDDAETVVLKTIMNKKIIKCAVILKCYVGHAGPRYLSHMRTYAMCVPCRFEKRHVENIDVEFVLSCSFSSDLNPRNTTEGYAYK